jgi:hypothetical protein
MAYASVAGADNNLTSLNGRFVRAFLAEYTFASLLLDTDEVVNFSTSEIVVGKWFEVFPICPYVLPPDYILAWTEFEKPIEVVNSMQLWRDEWQELAADDRQFIGAGPRSTQFATALDLAPQSANNVVKVLAGIKLVGKDGRCIVVCSSDNTPFKIDFAVNEQDIERIMKFHTCT